jgi:hypothetical protein
LPVGQINDNQLAGDYAMPDNPAFKMTVTLNASTLSLTLPGQPPYTLEPAQGTTFVLKDRSDSARVSCSTRPSRRS